MVENVKLDRLNPHLPYSLDFQLGQGLAAGNSLRAVMEVIYKKEGNWERTNCNK